MNIKKIAKFIVLSVVLSIAIVKVHYFFTDGFRYNKIYQYHYRYFNQEKACNVKSDPQIDEILTQPFYYLAKGRQTYVFQSKDKKYVIKFLRQRKYKKPFYITFCEKIFINRKKHQNFLKHQKIRKKRAYDSYGIANDTLVESCAIVHMQLDQKYPIEKKVVLFDKLKRRFKINLKDCRFFIQKSQTPIKEKLLKCANDEKKLRELIILFYEHIFSRYQTKVLNRDYKNSLENVGFNNYENKLFDIDIGSFYKDEFLFEKSFKKEMLGHTKPLFDLLNKINPKILSFATFELERYLKKYEK
jgi:hypothetical protein